ncbi:MAG: pyridoxal-dependent decarboxylase, exosortase A system-associated [Pseudomonadota bacterium]
MTDQAVSKPKPKKQHAPQRGAEHQSDGLWFGGHNVAEVIERTKTTPTFLYVRNLMTTRVEALRRKLPPGIEFHYAIKANPHPEVVGHMASLVDGLDVASGGEIDFAMKTGVHPDDISFAGPGKTDEELAKAMAAGICVNLESEGEMRRLAKLFRGSGQGVGAAPQVAIRVNPSFQLKASGMQMSGGSQPFGVDAERVPAMLEELADLPLRFVGFHIFAGSQNLSIEGLLAAQSATFELAADLIDVAHTAPKWVNIGGGFGLPYFPGDQPLDLEPIGAHLNSCMEAYAERLKGTRIILELGRFMVGDAGIYVTRVVDKKASRGQTFLITDGGLHHQLAASGNFGQVLRRNYPVAIANCSPDSETEEVNVVGCLCTPLDRLGDKMALPKADVGDLVVLFLAGAYGRTASPEAFLGHPPPLEVVLD